MEPHGVVSALASIIEELPVIGKDQRNEQQGFNFQGMNDITAELKPLLAKHGVVMAPKVLERVYDTRSVSGNRVMHAVNLHIQFTFCATDGSILTTSGWGEGTDMGDKATPKAMTGALKSVLRQVLCIADQDATDADHSTPEETVVPPPPEETPEPWMGWDSEDDGKRAHAELVQFVLDNLDDDGKAAVKSHAAWAPMMHRTELETVRVVAEELAK